jgi:GGDEF domain-containing protein
MISLRKYLFAEKEDQPESVDRRVIGLLLHGIYLHAVDGERTDHDQFCADMRNLESQVTPQLPDGELLVVAGAAIKALEDYKQRTTRFSRRQAVELQKMVAMLTETVITIGGTNAQSVAKLLEIGKQLEHASVIEDIRVLKARLGDCLEAVRDETLRQKSQGDDTLEKLKEKLTSAQERTAAFPRVEELDKVTGLPNHEEAEKAIRTALATSKKHYVVAAVVSRVQAVNARFGYAVGDRVLNVFRGHFQGGLTPRDRCYRWRGPVLLALLQREDPIEHVSAEIRRFADLKLESTLEVGARAVLMPISAVWSIFPVCAPFDTLIGKIDTFVATQVSGDLKN